MGQAGMLSLKLETPEDAQEALQTIKGILKEKNCKVWHEYVTADNNRIMIGDGSELYLIDYFDFEGILAEIGKALAIADPERSFSGEASFWNSTTDWSGDDTVTYNKTTHILYVRENTADGCLSVICENCQEETDIVLSDYDGETEIQCENCGEYVPLDDIEDSCWSETSYYLIKDGKAEPVSQDMIE